MRLECWHTLTAELAAVRLMVGELDFRLATNDLSSTWDRGGGSVLTVGFRIQRAVRPHTFEWNIIRARIYIYLHDSDCALADTLISPSLAKWPRADMILGIEAASVSCTVSSCRLVILARHGSRLTR